MLVIVRLPSGKYLGHGNTEVEKRHAKLIDLSDHPQGAVLPGEPETIMGDRREHDLPVQAQGFRHQGDGDAHG